MTSAWSVTVFAAIAAIITATLAVVAFHGQSRAAFPGANGKIVFEDDRMLYIMDADGSNVSELTAGSQPAWSAAGTKIAFQRGYDIWVMDADGANQVNITNTASNEENPALSPDDQRIAFKRWGSPNSGIWHVREDGSDPIRLNFPEFYKVLNGGISWSPDGEKIASGGWDIYVADVGGSGFVQLTDDGALIESNPTWSPDESYIAWRKFDGKAHDIWVMDANGDNPVNLTDDAAKDLTPDWSPDGTKIVFASQRSGDALAGPYQIHVMNADGTCPTRISTRSGHHPAWQPVRDSTELSPPLTCASPSLTPGQVPSTGGDPNSRDSFAGIAVGVSAVALGVVALFFAARKTRVT